MKQTKGDLMTIVHTWMAAAAALLISTMATQADEGRTVAYTVDDEPYEGYFISPGPDAPLVLLIHDWDGLTDYERLRARMLAEEGYAVFAADLFGRGVRPAEMEERRRLTGALYENRARMRVLMQGALDAARGEGASVRRAVAMGYCFGGTAVLELARSGAPLLGFVSFHGGLATPEGQDYTATQGHVLVLHGTADSHITMDEFAGLAKELEAEEVPHEMITYGGAPHAFTVFGSDRYRPAAAAASWVRLVNFLETTFAAPPMK